MSFSSSSKVPSGLLTCLSLFVLPTVFGQLSFQGLGDLPGGVTSSQANAVNYDGSVVVGRSFSASGGEAFVWSDSGGIIGLGDLSGGAFSSSANTVTADGQTVYGTGTTDNFSEGFVWTSSGGMALIGTVGGLPISFANGASADGGVVAGTAGGVSFRLASGVGTSLGVLSGGSYSNGQALSGDGTTVVGNGNSSDGIQAFRWTTEGGMQGLGIGPSGVGFAGATGVNTDGSVVVGFYNDSLGGQAFRWTAETGIVSLGDLAGGSFSSSANAVSPDGQLVVGLGSSERGFEAMFWTAESGMVSLYDYVSGQGVDLSDWSGFSSATAISGDGTAIVGYGVRGGNTEAFLISGFSGVSAVPEPSSFAGLLGLFSLGWVVTGRRRARVE